MTARHLSVSTDPKVAAAQNSENARDLNSSLSGKVSGYLRTVARYAALGATTSKIPIAVSASKRPQAVLLANAQLTNDPGSDIGAVGRPNFYHDALGLGVYEPAGLVADELYDLTFLILE